MPSVEQVIEDIELNEALKALGITRFWKHSSVLQITINENTLLTFDVESKVQKTLSNFKKAPKEVELNGKILNEIKLILPRDYVNFLRFDVKSQASKKQGEGNKPVESARIAVNLAREFCQELFIDNLGSHMLAIKVGEHIEVVPIKTSKFKNWLSKLYYDVTLAQAKSQQERELSDNNANSNNNNTERKLFEGVGGDVLSTEALSKSLRVIIGQAEFSGKPRKQLYLRTAKTDDGTIYYDLTNPKWHCIKINHEGWSIISSPPIFRRYSHQMEQDIPDAIYPIDIFDNFLHTAQY